MVDEGERKGTNIFWIILPFIITSCFVIPSIIYGINFGEEGSRVGCAKFVFAHAESKEINTNGKRR